MEEHLRTWKDRDEVPPGIRFHSVDETHALAQEGPDAGIGKVIDSLLGSQEVNWKSALSTLLKGALTAIFGSAAAGESYKAEYVITMAGHAKTNSEPDTRLPVGLDYAVWTYTFTRTGVKTYCQSAIAFAMRSSLIDYAKLTDLDIFQLLRLQGTPPDLSKELSELIKANRHSVLTNVTRHGLHADAFFSAERRAGRPVPATS